MKKPSFIHLSTLHQTLSSLPLVSTLKQKKEKAKEKKKEEQRIARVRHYQHLKSLRTQRRLRRQRRLRLYRRSVRITSSPKSTSSVSLSPPVQPPNFSPLSSSASPPSARMSSYCALCQHANNTYAPDYFHLPRRSAPAAIPALVSSSLPLPPSSITSPPPLPILSVSPPSFQQPLFCQSCWIRIHNLSICWTCGESVSGNEDCVGFGLCWWHWGCVSCLFCRVCWYPSFFCLSVRLFRFFG